MIKTVALAVAISLSVAPKAFAGDDCTDAKQLVNLVEVFTQPDPKLANLIEPKFGMRLKAINDAPMPEFIFYKLGDERLTFPINAAGAVQGLESLAGKDPKGELCRAAITPAKDPDKDSMEVTMIMTFPFKDAPGEHSIDDLVEGAKDGSKVMNSLAPTGMGMFVQGLKRIVVFPLSEADADAADAADASPLTLTLMKDGTPVEFDKITRQDKAIFIRVKDLKRSKADRLVVSGGKYEISATFDDK